MYSEEGKSPAFVQYINRLLERGGDCYKILNALTYHISEEELAKMPAEIAKKHVENLMYIDKKRYLELIAESSDEYGNDEIKVEID